MSILPDFSAFGTTFRFGDLSELDTLQAENAPGTLTTDRVPLGVDLGFDSLTGDFEFTSGGDLKIVNEEKALHQWLVVALITPRNQDIIYSYVFGSQISELLGAGFVVESLVTEATQYISEAILIHDRILSVENFEYQEASGLSEALTFFFDVVTDEDVRFQFGGLQVG
jgi:hypothetical protein